MILLTKTLSLLIFALNCLTSYSGLNLCCSKIHLGSNFCFGISIIFGNPFCSYEMAVGPTMICTS
jgi:hypothetical protein